MLLSSAAGYYSSIHASVLRRPAKMSRRPNAEEAEEKLRGILQKATKLSLSVDSLSRLDGVKKLLRGTSRTPKAPNSLLPLLTGVISVTIALLYCLGLYTHAGFARMYLKWQGVDLYEELCAIYMPDQLVKAFRPPEDCSICQGLTQVDKVANISPDIFEERYAYNGRPVVVIDAMENWTAQHKFSFDFFKNLYGDSLDYWNYQTGCQFFPYETDFRDLREVFNMSEERANMREGTKPWYIGWSNCDDRTARILRRHYGRPYFLPETAENKKLDWIFMGSPGYGAHMHVDNVEHPSWQAQLRGSKKWILEPPPECYYHCNRIEVTVEKGEIIVLDTNRWYHSTLITSKEMSITIGAEYD